MTNKTKAAIEEAANQKYHPVSDAKRHYIAGMQEAIEHPEKYGLFTREQVLEIIRKGFSNE